MDAAKLLSLVYQRRAVVPGETIAQALAGVRADLRATHTWLAGLADHRTLTRPSAELSAEDAAATADNDQAIADSTRVDAWLNTKAGAVHLRESYADQHAAAAAAGALA